MTRYGENYELKQDMLDVIATYMDDDIREGLHFDIAPCSPEEFLKKYIELDPDFEDILKSEFSIEM